MNRGMIVSAVAGSRAKDLMNLHQLTKEIKAITERIAALKYRTKILTKKYTQSECEEMVQEIKNLEEFLLQRQKQCIQEQKRLEEFIESVPSPLMRNIFSYRYINHLTWQQVAFKVGEYDESCVRKKHDAYLNKINEEKEVI